MLASLPFLLPVAEKAVGHRPDLLPEEERKLHTMGLGVHPEQDDKCFADLLSNSLGVTGFSIPQS